MLVSGIAVHEGTPRGRSDHSLRGPNAPCRPTKICCRRLFLGTERSLGIQLRLLLSLSHAGSAPQYHNGAFPTASADGD